MFLASHISGASISLFHEGSLWLALLPCIVRLRIFLCEDPRISCHPPSRFAVCTTGFVLQHCYAIYHLKKRMEINFWNSLSPWFFAINKGSLHAPVFATLWCSRHWWKSLKGGKVQEEEGVSIRFFPLGKTFLYCSSVGYCYTMLTGCVPFCVAAPICSLWICKPLIFAFWPTAIRWMLSELKCCPFLWGEQWKRIKRKSRQKLEVGIWLLQLESYRDKPEKEMQNMKWV